MAHGNDMHEHDNGGHDHGDGSANMSAAPAADLDLHDDAALAELVNAIESADRVFASRFETLNNSGVSGDALLLLDGNQLRVIVVAEGLDAGLHPGHIHGQLGGINSTIPTLEQDTDNDGFVEVLEGAATYGPILLNFLTDPDAALDVEIGVIRADLPFPMTGADGKLVYSQTFDFSGEGQFADAIFDEIMPLQNRHIVLHGANVKQGQGAGTGGEVDGTAGYKAALPVANGEIFEVTTAFGKSLALANLVCPDDQECTHADLSFGMA